jgi:hypothetical protein
MGNPVTANDVCPNEMSYLLRIQNLEGSGFDSLCKIVYCHQNILMSIGCRGCNFTNDVDSPSSKGPWKGHTVQRHGWHVFNVAMNQAMSPIHEVANVGLDPSHEVKKFKP